MAVLSFSKSEKRKRVTVPGRAKMVSVLTAKSRCEQYEKASKTILGCKLNSPLAI